MCVPLNLTFDQALSLSERDFYDLTSDNDACTGYGKLSRPNDSALSKWLNLGNLSKKVLPLPVI